MFHTNREKFNTTTDFDESKYTYVFMACSPSVLLLNYSFCFLSNVPVRQMTADEIAEVDKKVSEIERTVPTEDIDEDDAGTSLNDNNSFSTKSNHFFSQGVKRPSELNPTHNIDDGNSNTKTNQASRLHTNDRRSDFRYDTEYNPK